MGREESVDLSEICLLVFTVRSEDWRNCLGGRSRRDQLSKRIEGSTDIVWWRRESLKYLGEG